MKKKNVAHILNVLKNGLLGDLFALLINLFWAFVCFGLCRILFIVLNMSYYPDLTGTHVGEMFRGGLVFDTSAILYINAL